MTTYLELHAEYADGTGEIVAVERNDAHGRRLIDGQGFDLVRRPYVRRVWSTPVDRRAMSRKGSYR